MPKTETRGANCYSPYNGSITREQFLFYEMRTTSKLVADNLTDEEVISRIVKDNLFQYPTEKSVKKMASTCLQRLHAMNDDTLIGAIASQPSEVSKQICLYAMMKQHRLVWDFMVTVVGEKYRLKESSFGKIDVNAFFLRLQEQDDHVASWSESTVKKIKQIIIRVLVENEYLDSNNSDRLNPVWLNPVLENGIRSNNDEIVLPAFNCFS